MIIAHTFQLHIMNKRKGKGSLSLRKTNKRHAKPEGRRGEERTLITMIIMLVGI